LVNNLEVLSNYLSKIGNGFLLTKHKVEIISKNSKNNLKYFIMSNLDIIKVREELGLSHRELAEQLGVDRRTIVNYEQGRLIPGSKIKLLQMLLQEKRSALDPLLENNYKEQLENMNREVLELKRTKELIAAGFSFDGNNYFVSDFKRLDMGTILFLSDSDFESILNAGKIELKRLADIETNRLEKEEEEKEAIYEIRKERLLEVGLTYSDEHDTIYVDSNSDYILLCSEILEASAIEFEKIISECKQVFNEFKAKQEIIPEVLEAVIIPETIPTVSPAMHYGVDIEEKAIEAISELVNPTVNVCYDLPKEPTWEAIEKDFKSSAEKSYSKWLKDNYNAPTKKQ